jgi:hypothetical protein
VAGSSRATALALATQLLQQISTANGFNTDAGARVYVGRKILNDQVLQDRAQYPFLTVTIDGSQMDFVDFMQLNMNYAIQINGFVWDDSESTDLVQLLFSDILAAVNSVTTRDRLRPVSHIEQPPPPGDYSSVITVDYIGQFPECFEEPVWLANVTI